ncbi:MAG TPA: sigma 54-interacting transcriptional regulator [Kofleriaceae bacterium]|nr:sigma 54-interacting transcriptional regulator [Kofleriaceae bacterium]
MTRPSDHTMSYDESRNGQISDFEAPYLVVGMECACPLAPARRHSIHETASVVIGRGAERGMERKTVEGAPTLRIDVPDGWMSGDHIRLVRASGQWTVADAGSKNGTFVNGVQIESMPLEDGDLIEAGNTVFVFRSAVRRGFRENVDLELDAATFSPAAMATLSIPLARQLAALARVAGSRVAVLIRGETGTGKELTARAIHELSGRSGPFVAINCGAIANSLVESELFGHRKGAFSGASEDRPGLVRAAHGGTLFLDEIAELPETSQVKLLRVLQEHEVLPVGGTTPVSVDIRIVAASHQDLSERSDEGSFRRDLYARLRGFEMDLPPLRDRREDVGLLAAALLRKLGGADARLQRVAGRALFCYDWPLNIRELEQVLGSALALCAGEIIGLEHLPRDVRDAARPGRPLEARPRAAAPVIQDELHAELIARLGEHRGNLSAVARDMGKARIQIRRWCKRYRIDVESFR